MSLPRVTIDGNLTADPELRFTASGQAVASFTVAQNKPQRQEDGSYKSGDATFLRCTVWNNLAENVAESLKKGTAVVGTGSLEVRKYQAKDGSEGTSVDVTLDSVGVSLRNATTPQIVRNAPRNQQGGGNYQQNPQQNQQQGPPQQQQNQRPQGNDDPWAQSGPAGGGFADEPPF